MKNEAAVVHKSALKPGAGIKATVKKAAFYIGVFFMGLATSACAVFPGVYPFGIALTAAVSGLGCTLAAYLGSLIGCAFIPGVGGGYAVILTSLFAARAVLSVYLGWDYVPDKIKKRGLSSLFSRNKIDDSGGPAELTSGSDNYSSYVIPAGEGSRTPHKPASQNCSGGAGAAVKNKLPRGRSAGSGTVLRFWDAAVGGVGSLPLMGENVKVRLLLSAAAALFGGAWSVVLGGFEYYDLFGAVFSLMITPVVTYLFYCALSRDMRASVMREIGVYALFFILSLSLHSMSVGGLFSTDGVLEGQGSLSRGGIWSGSSGAAFDFGVLFSAVLVMAVTGQFGVYRGVMAAFSSGIALSPAYAIALALGAAVEALIRRFSLSLSMFAFSAASSAYGIMTGGLFGFLSIFPPTAAGFAVALPLIKAGVLEFSPRLFGSEIKSARTSAESEANRVMAVEYQRRVTDLSRSLISASGVMQGLAGKLSRPRLDDVSESVDGIFERYCGLCRNRGRCSAKILELKKEMAQELLREGEVSAAVIPVSIATVCWNIGKIIDEANSAFRLAVRGMAGGDQLSAAAEDSLVLGEMLCGLSGDLKEEFSENRELTSRLKRQFGFNNIHATGVRVSGVRRKRVYVGDIELASTRIGGEDISRLVGSVLGGSFTVPQFSLSGAVLSMSLESEKQISAKSGYYALAASAVQKYYGGERGRGADCEVVSGVGNGFSAEAEGESGVTGRYSADLDISCGNSGGHGAARDKNSVKLPISSSTGEVSGDGIEAFEANGRSYMIICDGMGNGREAAVASGMAITLLKRYIEGGADLEGALKLLNRILRRTGRECSVTMDICEADLYTGEARFIKSGAAPSFVIRGDSVYRLQSKTVPIGIIRALDAEATRFILEPGDVIVMLSDGVARSFEESPWLVNLLVSSELIKSGSETLAAMEVVSEAALRGSRDDITCGVMRIVKE